MKNLRHRSQGPTGLAATVLVAGCGSLMMPACAARVAQPSPVATSCSGTADLADELTRRGGSTIDLAHPGYVARKKQNPDKTDFTDDRQVALHRRHALRRYRPVEECSVAPCGRRKSPYCATHEGWRYTWATGSDFFNRLLNAFGRSARASRRLRRAGPSPPGPIRKQRGYR